MKLVYRAIVLLCIILFFWYLLQRTPRKITAPREEIWIVMGTVASLRTPASEREHFPVMLQIAKDTFDAVNRKLSVYDPDSELSVLHREGALSPISPLTKSFLTTTIEMTEKANDFFDPSLLPVIQLWGFSGGVTPTNLPTADQIADALDSPRIADLSIDQTGARYAGKPAHIDPGGIAKGFALDLAFEKIEQQFPDAHFLLNLGGEMRAKGKAEADRPWQIGIQHPFEKQAAIGIIRVPSRFAVATSGHYERYTEIEGERYAHIIDPQTGWPVSGMAGVTVLSPNSTEADVLSTALFVAGEQQANPLRKRFPESEAILIPDREPIEIYMTPGMQAWFEPYPAFRDNIQPWEKLGTQTE